MTPRIPGFRRISTVAAAAALVAAFTVAPAASASNVAWNVSVGGPGFGVTVGQPGFWGGGARGYWGPRPGFVRPWVRPVVAAPVFVPGPVVFPAPAMFPAPVAVAAPVVFPAPLAVPVVVPRRVVVAPAWRAPVATPFAFYNGYGR